MPRKTTETPEARRARLTRASMRPRPDAAENLDCSQYHRIRHSSASMRPRPDAAENVALSTVPPPAQLELQ